MLGGAADESEEAKRERVGEKSKGCWEGAGAFCLDAAVAVDDEDGDARIFCVVFGPLVWALVSLFVVGCVDEENDDKKDDDEDADEEEAGRHETSAFS